MKLYTQDIKYKLSKSNKEWLPAFIAKKWDRWDEDRRECLDVNRKVMDLILPKKNPKYAKFEQLPDLYESYMGFRSNLWKDFFKNYETMFDARGRTYEDNQYAALQKDALINNFEDFNFELSLEEIADEYIKNGEVTAFCYWDEQITKQVYNKSKSELEQEWSVIAEQFLSKGVIPTAELIRSAVQESVIKTNVDFSGVRVKVIPAASIVYDVNRKQNWAKCPKIYREFLPYAEIVSDEFYQEYLTKEIKQELKEFLNTKNELNERNDNRYYEKDNQRYYKGQIEILEYWGDISLPNGDLLENWLIVVAGGKYVLRCEPNPYIDCPIIHSCYLEHQDLKRGISLLSIALTLSEISDEVLKSQLSALKLIIDPAYLGPEGAIKTNANGKIVVKPGGYISYDIDLADRPPTKLDFKDALIGFQFMNLFEQKIESGTGVFKNMTGDPTGKERTATEVVETSTGANVRLNHIIDYLNFTVKIPVIKTVAKILSNFKTEPEEVTTKLPQYNGFAMVDQNVRSGNYKYRIGGSDDTAYRRQVFKEALPVLSGIFSDPVIKAAIKPDEFMKWVLENLGIKDPERLIDFNKLAMYDNENGIGASTPPNTPGASIPPNAPMPQLGQLEGGLPSAV